MKALVVGTGYVGLTTGVALAYLGHKVTCLDVDPRKIDMLQAGQVPIYEPGLPELLKISRNNLRFVLSYDEGEVSSSDVVFICVGTPSLPDGSADLSYVKQAAEAVGERLTGHFTVVVNKSTVPIGSGNWVGSLIRESYERCQGCKPDGAYAVASNPEFLRQGSGIYDTLYPDRVVVGSEDPRAIDVLTNLYRPLLNQDFPAPAFLPRPEGLSAVPLVTCDLASAELIKYAANAFLALKISYTNEIAHLAAKVGADITQITRGMGLDSRIGPRFLQAGIGWGGSCFGKDTAALVSTAKEYRLEMPIVQAARDVNYRQRMWVVEALQGALKILKGRTIAFLGFAFKPNTDDLRDAPALDIAGYLIQRGARVSAHDPVALANARRLYPDLGVRYCDDAMEALEDADAVVLVTEWPEYRKLPWAEIKDRLHNPLVLDGRNFLSGDELEKLGFKYIGIGK
ncbi:MAG: UDP-glucose/GDP-mannose dehydrogenase family protein [Anaerolineaceae bacterium]|nr:UDP-glucose/GDP-mannose dehydrogenase family protein [Anaerolineaceae bacterium]